MARLPAPLQPLFPALKRAHRFATRASGTVGRATSPLMGDRGLPVTISEQATHTALREPETVAYHLGGPAEVARRKLPTGIPSSHWFFESKRNFDFGPRFTLAMRDGSVVGNYAAHLTASGCLDLETSSYFGIASAHEHPIYLRARLPEPTHVEGRLLSLAAAGSFGNYYHWVMDAMPRLGVLREAMPPNASDATFDALYTNTDSRYHREFLELLGLSSVPRVEATKHACAKADLLLNPAIVNAHTMGPQWVTTWLRETFATYDAGSKPPLIYLTRGDRPNTRRVNNEAELLGVLKPLGFEVIDPGTLGVQEQIDHFAAARVIVAPHGAALTNLNFCRPGVRLLEFFSPSYLNPGYWTIVDNVPDSTYRYLVGKGVDPGPGGSNNAVMSDITVDLFQVRSILDEILTD